MEERSCPVCKIVFQTNRKTKKYCSLKCQLKAYRIRNLETIRERERQHYEMHKKEIQEMQKEWRKKHPEKNREYAKTQYYRRKKKYGTSNGISCKTFLTQHHEMMKEDPERLTSSFLAEITGCSCNKYPAKKEGI